MISSFIVSVGFIFLQKQGIYSTTTAEKLIFTIIITTICWLMAAYFAPQTDQQKLIDFYLKVRPAGPGWAKIRQEAGITEDEVARGDNIPLAMLGWLSGCIMIWSSLFTVGSFLYGRITNGAVLLLATLLSGTALVFIINKLWSGESIETVVENK